MPVQRQTQVWSLLRAVLVVFAVSSTAVSVVLEPSLRQYPAIAVLQVLVIVGFATAGALLAVDPIQRSNGTLLILTAVLQGITHLRLVDNSPLPMIAWVCGPLSAMPAAVVLLRFPGPTMNSLARRWAIFNTAWLIGSRLTFTVPTPERRLGWWPAIPMSPPVAVTASVVGNVVLIASTLFFAFLLARRIRQSRGVARHELAPILTAAIAACSTVVLHLGSVATSRGGVHPVILGIEQFGLMTVPAAFIFSAIAMRMARAAVADLLLRTNYSTSLSDLQDGLARTLSDPSLRLYVSTYRNEWADVDGQVTEPTIPAGQIEVRVVGDDDAPLAVIVTDSSISGHKRLLDATVAATRLTLQNAASRVEVQRSRIRLAEAELAERKRLERDLHDGAQQRLLALGFSLDQVRQAAPDDRTRALIDAATQEVQGTIRELRDLARGIHPAVLTQSGLATAAQGAIERMPLRVTLRIPPNRWPPPIEATSYFVICEALNNIIKHAESDQATVEVSDSGKTLTITITDNGRGGADPTAGTGLVGLSDRVAALSGTFTTHSPTGGGTCLTAQLPYA